MGSNLGPLLQPKTIKIDDLKGSTIAIDAFNILYQFITTIRGPDGSYLSDSKGQITSHLTGLFSRTINLLQKGIKPIYVYDGEPPALKRKERERRRELKEEAQVKYESAKDKEDVAEMKKFAGRTARLTGDMIEESKLLLARLGVPTVQAPSEGEAQVARIVRNGHAMYGISQDYDSLLHGNPRIVRNLSSAGRRKRGPGFVTVTPELIELPEVLNSLGIDHNQLIALATLIGTDYNIGGVRGIGPKKALTMVKKHGVDYESLFLEAGWTDDMPPWKEIIDVIKDMPVTDDYQLEWTAPDKEAVVKLLVEKHDFSADRVEGSLSKLQDSAGARAQKGLGEFF